MKKLLAILFAAFVLTGCGVKNPTGNVEADGRIAAEYLSKGDGEAYAEFIKKCNKYRDEHFGMYSVTAIENFAYNYTMSHKK